MKALLLVFPNIRLFLRYLIVWINVWRCACVFFVKEQHRLSCLAPRGSTDQRVPHEPAVCSADAVCYFQACGGTGLGLTHKYDVDLQLRSESYTSPL